LICVLFILYERNLLLCSTFFPPKEGMGFLLSLFVFTCFCSVYPGLLFFHGCWPLETAMEKDTIEP
jgi:hypothetical protein